MTKQQALNQLRLMQAWHEDFGNGPCPDYDAICYAINIIEAQPAVPKTGKWIDHRDEGYVECPFCRSATNCDGNIDELHYCFSCGAKMEG